MGPKRRLNALMVKRILKSCQDTEIAWVMHSTVVTTAYMAHIQGRQPQTQGPQRAFVLVIIEPSHYCMPMRGGTSKAEVDLHQFSGSLRHSVASATASYPRHADYATCLLLFTGISRSPVQHRTISGTLISDPIACTESLDEIPQLPRVVPNGVFQERG
jgi:hypothetical protein